MSKNIGIGDIGENIAARFLIRKGYTILDRNYRRPWGEIDIIGRAPDRTLVFFEVKTLRDRGDSDQALQPEDNLTAAKSNKLRRIASMAANNNPELINEKKGWRIDLITILSPRHGVLTIKIKDCIIKHYENI